MSAASYQRSRGSNLRMLRFSVFLGSIIQLALAIALVALAVASTMNDIHPMHEIVHVTHLSHWLKCLMLIYPLVALPASIAGIIGTTDTHAIRRLTTKTKVAAYGKALLEACLFVCSEALAICLAIYIYASRFKLAKAGLPHWQLCILFLTPFVVVQMIWARMCYLYCAAVTSGEGAWEMTVESDVEAQEPLLHADPPSPLPSQHSLDYVSSYQHLHRENPPVTPPVQSPANGMFHSVASAHSRNCTTAPLHSAAPPPFEFRRFEASAIGAETLMDGSPNGVWDLTQAPASADTRDTKVSAVNTIAWLLSTARASFTRRGAPETGAFASFTGDTGDKASFDVAVHIDTPVVAAGADDSSSVVVVSDVGSEKELGINKDALGGGAPLPSRTSSLNTYWSCMLSMTTASQSASMTTNALESSTPGPSPRPLQLSVPLPTAPQTPFAPTPQFHPYPDLPALETPNGMTSQLNTARNTISSYASFATPLSSGVEYEAATLPSRVSSISDSSGYNASESDGTLISTGSTDEGDYADEASGDEGQSEAPSGFTMSSLYSTLFVSTSRDPDDLAPDLSVRQRSDGLPVPDLSKENVERNGALQAMNVDHMDGPLGSLPSPNIAGYNAKEWLALASVPAGQDAPMLSSIRRPPLPPQDSERHSLRDIAPDEAQNSGRGGYQGNGSGASHVASAAPDQDNDQAADTQSPVQETPQTRTRLAMHRFFSPFFGPPPAAPASDPSTPKKQQHADNTPPASPEPSHLQEPPPSSTIASDPTNTAAKTSFFARLWGPSATS